ncbi:stage II sporulation protein M [Candidatus Woesearchaeota archaeon]|nr:stage II sporulation protein M [Candidatus Woesearchaeota archaeon]
MVLEALIGVRSAEKRPWELFLIGLVYSTLAIILSMWIFSAYTSIVIVALTALMSAPIIHHIIQYEEKKDEMIEGERQLLKEHSKAVSVFAYLFLGFVATYVLWFVLMPPEAGQSMFKVQLDTITEINLAPSETATGNAISQTQSISHIFLNNTKILIFCVLFSFFYGAGAIFILVWNASVIGTAIGLFLRHNIMSVLHLGAGYYPTFILKGLAKYLFIHGIPEVLAYFIGSLAGGIISVAVIRHEYRSKAFKRTLLDSADLIMISLLILFVAALLEVFVTPMLI